VKRSLLILIKKRRYIEEEIGRKEEYLNEMNIN